MRFIIYQSLLIILLGLFLPATASAQPPEDLPRRPKFTFGAAVGGSFLFLDSVTGSSTRDGLDIAIAWRVGYRLSDRLALILTAAASVYDHEGPGRSRKRSFEGLFPSVQYWVTPQLWLAAGPGLNLDAPAFYDIDSAAERSFHRGIGGVATAGYEVHHLQPGNLRVEILTRVHAGYSDVPGGRQYGTSVSLLAGVGR